MKRNFKTKTLFIFLILIGIINAQPSPESLYIAIQEENIRKVIDLTNEGVLDDIKRTSPLIFTAKLGNTKNDHIMAEITKILLVNKENPATRDRLSRTPLIWAAKNGAYEVLKMLLETKKGKATIDMQDKKGNTALIQTTIAEITDKKRLKMAKELLKKGANPNIINTKGKIALFYAKQAGNTAIINLLRSYTISIRKPIVKKPPMKRPAIMPVPPMTVMPVPIQKPIEKSKKPKPTVPMKGTL